MNDPYKILGVSSNASDDEVKTAYRELARKYHPDSYQGNPLSDLAAEKMKEVNDAYDRVQNMRRSKTQHSSARTGQSSYSSSQFADIRTMINTGRVAEAEELLDGVPQGSRDAEWFFLKGSIFYSRGWIEESVRHFNTASRMNPNNQEYAAAANRMMWQRQNGAQQYNRSAGGCDACSFCQTLICADCCCECCGGDLIHCC